MAEDYKVTDIASVAVSAKVMAELLGVGTRQIRNLAEEGILMRSAHGKYLLCESVKNYIITLKLSKAGEKIQTMPDNLNLDEEKAKHEHLKCCITEIKLKLISGKVHRSEDVQRVVTDMLVRLRSKLVALPAKMAGKLAGRTREEIQELLKNEISGALQELSDYNPADYYSDEHIDIEENNVFSILEEGKDGEED